MRRSSLLTVCFALTIPAFLAAQTTAPEPRTGFWISAGLGGGPRDLDCAELCTHEFGKGTGLDLSLGGTLNERWLIGGDVVGWFPWSGMDEGYGDDTDGFGAVLFTARHYPRAQSGFFVTGGLGLAEIDVQQDSLEAKGYVGKIGIGYDLRAGRNFSFTPFFTLVRTFGTEARISGDIVDGDVNFGMALFGMALTWH